MRLVRFNPRNDLFGLSNDFNRFFNIFNDQEDRELSPMGFSPRVDIKETTNGIEINADIPGVDKKDISITVKDNILTISGEKVINREEKNDEYHRIERFSGQYKRSFQLSPSSDTSKVNATYTNGVLTISVPNLEEKKPLEIPIEVK